MVKKREGVFETYDAGPGRENSQMFSWSCAGNFGKGGNLLRSSLSASLEAILVFGILGTGVDRWRGVSAKRIHEDYGQLVFGWKCVDSSG
jgi:hypothetical protein